MKKIELRSNVECTADKSFCTTITIVYPEFNRLKKQIKEKLVAYMIQRLNNHVPGATNFSTLQDVGTEYIRWKERLADCQKKGVYPDWLWANFYPQVISDTLITISVRVDSYNDVGFIHFNPKTGSVCNNYKSNIENFEPFIQISKVCPWPFAEFEDQGKAPPDEIGVMLFPVSFPDQFAYDSIISFNDSSFGNKVNLTITAGEVKIDKARNDYVGIALPPDDQERGITKFELIINGKYVNVSYDYLLHPDIMNIRLAHDYLSNKYFIYIACGDGGGSAQALFVIEDAKVTGHYDWVYGHDHWRPRNDLDSFRFNKNDTCDVYYVNFFKF